MLGAPPASCHPSPALAPPFSDSRYNRSPHLSPPDIGAVHLARLTALTSLNLSQNPRLGDGGVRSLAAHLGELQVGRGG